MFKYFFVVFMANLFIISSCGDQQLDEISIPLGEGYIHGNSDVFYTDTFSLQLGTIKQDSVLTSGTKTALIGRYFNDEIGGVNVKSVFRLKKPLTIPFIDIETNEFDSIRIDLRHSGFYVGDTTEVISLSFHRVNTDLLKERIKLIDGSRAGFYNNYLFDYEPEALGTVDFLSQPRSKDSILVRLNDSFGLELFNKIANGDFKYSDMSLSGWDSDEFYGYLQGIAIVANGNTKSIIGLNATSSVENEKVSDIKLHLYFTEYKQVATKKEYIFQVEESGLQFYTSEFESVNPSLSPLFESSSNLVSSKNSGNHSYIQGVNGFVTKVNFPELGRAFELNNLNKIIKAELMLVLDEDTYIKDVTPSELLLFRTNKFNENLGVVVQGKEELKMKLKSDKVDNKVRYYYSVDLTQQLINELIDKIYDENFSFIIGLPAGVERTNMVPLIFGGENNSINYRPRLKLYTYKY